MPYIYFIIKSNPDLWQTTFNPQFSLPLKKENEQLISYVKILFKIIQVLLIISFHIVNAQKIWTYSW